ncbi:MAG TPA: hypothetical protein VF981_10060 [Gemmatimonadaceae bacterium]
MVRTAAALAGLTLVPSLAFAQGNGSSNSIRDSWFWGINGGAMLFNAGYDEEVMVTAPSVGGEWFITRTQIALRLAVQQAFFDKQAAVYDPTVGGARPVNVKDWRRYSAEIFFLPSGDRSLTPYLGLGLALNVLQNAAPVGSFVSEESLEEVFALVDDYSSRASLIFAAGAQYTLGRSALFVQASAMPTRQAFLLSRSQYTIGLEAGIRYNVGSAIDKF